MSKITVIDYGAGNIASVVNMIKYIGGEAVIADHPDALATAQKLLLPGVGAFDHGMEALTNTGWIGALNNCVLEKKIPVLGICLGMQMMCRQSEEGHLKGLSWIDADVKQFSFDRTEKLKVPHMGWNRVNIARQDSLIPANSEDVERFYFVHSYYVECDRPEDVIFTCNYGKQFVAGFNHQNIWGVQFHPEKSHRFGMALFKRFLEF